MKLNLITLETVKTELGISDSSLDADITAMIPKVSADVRRILNNQYCDNIPAEVTSGSDKVVMIPAIVLGTVIQSDSFPDDTYIIGFDWETSEHQLSTSATADADYVNPTVSVYQWPAIAKMVYYRISKASTTAASEKNLASKSIGSVSVSYAEGEINSKYDYPQKLIDDLGVPYVRVG